MNPRTLCETLATNIQEYRSNMVHKCKACFKTFKTEPSLAQHYTAKLIPLPEFDAEGQPIIRCMACSKTFKTEADMIQHIKNRNNQSHAILKSHFMTSAGDLKAKSEYMRGMSNFNSVEEQPINKYKLYR